MSCDIWTERYRPRKLDEVVGQDQVISRLKEYVKTKNLPHLMFTGYRGTGKTTCATVLAKEILGDNYYGNFKEINSSDNRGIEVVRTQIKDYASTQPLGDVPFKIILLDEADSTTDDFQSALRRTMEKYTSSCRFILSCNYSSKIIEPIQSRTAVYKFKGISPDAMKSRLRFIAEKENLIIDEDALDAIVYVAEFDMRKAVGCLETASLLGKNITVESIYKSSGLARREDIRDFIMTSLKGNYISAFEKLDIFMIEEGLAAQDLLTQIFKETMELNVSDKSKLEIVDVTGEADFRINEGANERIQMRWLVSKLINIGK